LHIYKCSQRHPWRWSNISVVSFDLSNYFAPDCDKASFTLR
jgi:hypothetical protein